MTHSCPNCGMTIECDTPRHAPRGSGAHYSSKIKNLTKTHRLALDILREKGAVDPEHGLGLSQMWKIIWDRRSDVRNFHVPSKQGLSGRLSELQGLGRVKSVRNSVRLYNPLTQTYRSEQKPLWYLNGHSD